MPLARPFLFLFATLIGALADAYQPRNTQRPGEEPPTPGETLDLMTLPEGFQVTLFASEPAVRQPIAMTTDDRGRIWVIESYSHKEWENRGEDRILILEDTDGDGRQDSRKVFYDKGNHFTGLTLGFGGVWVCDPPNIIFIPDRDRDDQPDSAPEIILDGWTLDASHNMVNGLNWGPDGWLYGNHGVLAESRPGAPGTPLAERPIIDCGIWRYHPKTKAFEVYARGTTNPWGTDWDEHGEMFMSGNVNGHLWHVVSGAYYERMHPSSRFPYVYERLTMSADTPHYHGTANWKRDWNRDQIGRNREDQLGGGHSHCGALIYQGGNWPEVYRGKMFMNNTHGRRVNQDRLVRRGSTYMGEYEGDFMRANHSWFRGVSLVTGPDGAVYVSDWTDDGECHDDDGVHRTSGRIYKIRYGEPDPWKGDLAKATPRQMVNHHHAENAWFYRKTRRLIQERGRLPGRIIAQLKRMASNEKDVRVRLRSLWTLASVGALDDAGLLSHLQDPSEHVRAWAVRLLADKTIENQEVIGRLVQLAETEPSALVRLYLAASAQRIPVSRRLPLVLTLTQRTEDESDRMIPLMIWYAAEPTIAGQGEAFLNPPKPALTKVQAFAARRLTEYHAETAEEPNTFPGANAQGPQAFLLDAMREGALRHPSMKVPAVWLDRIVELTTHKDHSIAQSASALAVTFQHEATISRFAAEVLSEVTTETRRADLLGHLLEIKSKEIDQLLLNCVLQGKPPLRVMSLRALSKRSVTGWEEKILADWSSLSADERDAAVDALAARPKTAKWLLEALAAQTVRRQDIRASQAQQLAALRDDTVRDLLEKHWGSLQRSSEAKQKEMARYRDLLAGSAKPDLANGAAVYERVCAACHQLFGEGGKLGPDLTGSDRASLDYLLTHIVEPSASVAADHRLTIVTKKDGSVVTGSVIESNRSSVLIRNLAGEERIAKEAIANRKTLKTSMMPEGLLTTLTDREVVDLIRYLQTNASGQ